MKRWPDGFLWGTATRLLDDKRAAFFAAALFAALAPTLHLGSYATYDAPALLLLAMATWCAAGARSGQHAIRRPTERHCLLGKPILPIRGFTIVPHLPLG